MGGGEWQTNSNRRARPTGSLSAWCDLNLPSAKGAKIATLVAKKEATEGVVAILKKFQKRGAELGKVQRCILEVELDGAGQWSAAATPSLASRRWAAPWAAPTPAPDNASRPARGREGRERAGSRRQTETSATPDGGNIAVVNRRRRKSKGQQSESAHTAAAPTAKRVTLVETEPSEIEVVDDHADIEVEPNPPQWICPACATEHDFTPKKLCRLCKVQRAVIGPAAQAAASAEEDALAVAKYKGLIAAIVALGNLASPGDLARKESCNAKIAIITKPKAPASEPLPSARHNAAMVALEAAQIRNATLMGVQLCIQQEIARKQVELDRIAIAIALALQHLSLTISCYFPS